MASFNKVILIGNLTKVPELKQTASGHSCTDIVLAVDRKYQGQDTKTDFFKVKAYRGTAEFIYRNFTKGNSILVCGELHTDSWVDNQGDKHYDTYIEAEEARFCESKRESQREAQDIASGTVNGLRSPMESGSATDYNLPF